MSLTLPMSEARGLIRPRRQSCASGCPKLRPACSARLSDSAVPVCLFACLLVGLASTWARLGLGRAPHMRYIPYCYCIYAYAYRWVFGTLASGVRFLEMPAGSYRL